MIPAALATFFVVALEMAEAVFGVTAVGVARGWSGALLGAAAALVVALIGASILIMVGVSLPARPVKLVAAVLLIGMGVWWLMAVVRS